MNFRIICPHSCLSHSKQNQLHCQYFTVHAEKSSWALPSCCTDKTCRPQYVCHSLSTHGSVFGAHGGLTSQEPSHHKTPMHHIGAPYWQSGRRYLRKARVDLQIGTGLTAQSQYGDTASCMRNDRQSNMRVSEYTAYQGAIC